MTTITLPPDLEERLAAEARQRGTTTELLALESLRQRFVPTMPGHEAAVGETLYDFLTGHIGTVDGAADALSDDCGRHFAEGMEGKQRRGRL